MKLRIIAGKFGGRNIASPTGHTTHPMGDRIKSSLFNILTSRLVGADVLDAFAGTGALGFEALSRGAQSVSFIEKDRKAYDVIVQNIQALQVADVAQVVQVGLSTWLDKNVGKSFDIIFVDPPYDNLQLAAINRLSGLLRDSDSVLVLSYPNFIDAPIIENLSMYDNRNYGDANLAFYSLG